jgi:hypothetical protein
VSYGAGLALIVDEFALLLDLKDVYWVKQGRVSVDLGVGTTALGGTALAATPILRRLLHPHRPGIGTPAAQRASGPMPREAPGSPSTRCAPNLSCTGPYAGWIRP